MANSTSRSQGLGSAIWQGSKFVCSALVQAIIKAGRNVNLKLREFFGAKGTKEVTEIVEIEMSPNEAITRTNNYDTMLIKWKMRLSTPEIEAALDAHMEELVHMGFYYTSSKLVE